MERCRNEEGALHDSELRTSKAEAAEAALQVELGRVRAEAAKERAQAAKEIDQLQVELQAAREGLGAP